MQRTSISLVLAVLLGCVLAWTLIQANAGGREHSDHEDFVQREQPEMISQGILAEEPEISASTRNPEEYELTPEGYKPRTMDDVPGDRSTTHPPPIVEPLAPELKTYARDEFVRGWRELRSTSSPDELQIEEALEAFKHNRLLSLSKLGALLAVQTSALELAESLGPGFALLQEMLHSKSGKPGDHAAGDPRIMDSFFVKQRLGPFKDGGEWVRSKESLSAGSTLIFGEGVFRIGELAPNGEPIARALTLRGAGMHQTLLVMDAIVTDSVLVNFAIEDCTVYSPGGSLIELLKEPCSMRFEDARFVGVDSKSGSSGLLNAPAGIFLARRCVFDGSFGPIPSGFSRIFDVRSKGLLARFEDCSFRYLQIHEVGINAGASLVYWRSDFFGVLDNRLGIKGGGVSFQDCSFSSADSLGSRLAHHDLNELFPNWMTRMIQ